MPISHRVLGDGQVLEIVVSESFDFAAAVGCLRETRGLAGRRFSGVRVRLEDVRTIESSALGFLRYLPERHGASSCEAIACRCAPDVLEVLALGGFAQGGRQA